MFLPLTACIVMLLCFVTVLAASEHFSPTFEVVTTEPETEKPIKGVGRIQLSFQHDPKKVQARHKAWVEAYSKAVDKAVDAMEDMVVSTGAGDAKEAQELVASLRTNTPSSKPKDDFERVIITKTKVNPGGYVEEEMISGEPDVEEAPASTRVYVEEEKSSGETDTGEAPASTSDSVEEEVASANSSVYVEDEKSSGESNSRFAPASTSGYVDYEDEVN